MGFDCKYTKKLEHCAFICDFISKTVANSAKSADLQKRNVTNKGSSSILRFLLKK